MKLAAFAVAILALPLVCPAQDQAKPRPPNVGGVDAAGTGTVTGLVKFTGEKPDPKPLSEIAGNAFCKECHKDKVPLAERFVFGKNGSDETLVNVLVYVSKGLEGKTFEVPKTPVVLDQVGCIYIPHVVGVMAGQVLEVRNSDDTLHNVMTMPRKNPGFNFGMPVKGGKVEKVFKIPEMKIDLRCFMHGWMVAYVHVLEHPFFAVTPSDGTFTIRGLPPGEYEISVLHETSQFETPAPIAVKVTADGTARADFTYVGKK
jgi:hypothetical protein